MNHHSQYQVTNYAADGFTSQDVLEGNRPMLSARRWADAGEPFPGCEHDVVVFKPLDALEALMKRDDPPSHVVLSVGGNDVREILKSMHLIRQVIHKYHSNGEKILNRIQNMKTKLVLMMQYRPSFHMDLHGYGVYQAMKTLGSGDPMLLMNRLMNTVYAPLLVLAKRLGVPIIDLPNTFDPYDKTYFECQIEPSEKGSDLIAEMIDHVVRNHKFDGPSMMYSKNVRSSKAMIESVVTLQKPWAIERYNKEDGSSIPVSSTCATTTSTATNTATPTTTTSVAPVDHAVSQLVDMGFPRDKVIEALQKSGNLPQRAIELLLSSALT